VRARVFISYARDDDASPPGRDPQHPLAGFVKTLHGHLEHALKQLGPQRPELWRDVGNVERTDQFKEVIERKAKRSDFLIVVFSPNWLSRDWCRDELEWFHQRWAHEGDNDVRKRILLVNKRSVELTARPELLQGQEGHDFFWIDREQHESARERPYYDAGEFQNPEAFLQQVRELAYKLYRLAAEKSGFKAPDPGGTAARPNGRTIFLARPADDMRQSYARLANELLNRGFTVVPDAEIPSDRSAVGFIEAALTQAELSIHLLGEKRGYAPAEEEPIVRLQLSCAAARARLPDPAREQNGQPRFRRVVWAPKIFEDPDKPAASAAGERDPLAVLIRFGKFIDGVDFIESDTLSPFVQTLVRYLDKNQPRQPSPATVIGRGAQIYLEHDEKDFDYAVALAEALQQRSITPILPVFQGPRAQRTAVNRRSMQVCDAVALCWGTASEVWMVSAAGKLRDWRERGAKENRSSVLVAAPPPGALKERRVKIKLPDVDMVVNLTSCDKPSPEDLDPWLGPCAVDRVGPIQGA
jgi:hypothetical protein